MTREEEMAYARYKQKEEERERKRLATLSKQDQMYAEQHARINMALMGGESDKRKLMLEQQQHELMRRR
jgi:hypothetical protein